jgi:hypothetical protein
MRASIRIISAFLTVIAGGSCDGARTASPGDQMLTTDSASYTAIPVGYDQVVVNVVTRFHNTTSAAVSIDRCLPTEHYPPYDVELVRPQSTEGAGYNPSWACVGGVSPIVIAPGETRTDTLTLHGPDAYDNRLGKYLGVLAGTFRVGYGGQYSNEFDIKLPPEGVVPYVPRDLSAAILTDSQLVHLTFQSQSYASRSPIRVTIFNPRPDTSFIVNCRGGTGVSLEKQVGSQWVGAWSNVVLACLSPAIVIPPNGRYETSIALNGGSMGTNVAPRFSVSDIPGVYRLVWSDIVDSFAADGSTFGKPIAVEYRRSNPFAIVVDP